MMLLSGAKISSPTERKVVRKMKRSPNELSTPANAFWHFLFFVGCLMCLVPLWIVISASFTSEPALIKYGYGFWPAEFSAGAYTFLFTSGGGMVVTAYRNTILATLFGTVLCTLSVGLYAYPISRKDFRFSGFFTFFSFFTMLFNAGTIPFYLLCTSILHINNTLFALFLPLSFSAYWVIIMRSFYRSNVPDEVIESARIDGAGEWRTLTQIVAPLAIPGFATVSLFAAVGIWNNFFNCLLLVNKDQYINLQYMIYRILRSIQYLKEMAASGSGAGSAQGGISLAEMPSETFRMAMAVVTMGPIVLAYPFFQKYFVKGLTIGAVKG